MIGDLMTDDRRRLKTTNTNPQVTPYKLSLLQNNVNNNKRVKPLESKELYIEGSYWLDY